MNLPPVTRRYTRDQLFALVDYIGESVELRDFRRVRLLNSGKISVALSPRLSIWLHRTFVDAPFFDPLQRVVVSETVEQIKKQYSLYE